jgi:hypothetical protein
MESKSREQEQFENWFKFHADPEELHMLDTNSAGTNYLHPHTDIAWIAWQASRSALVVELPEPFVVEMGAYGDAKVVSVAEAIESIRAAGITVKGEGDEANANDS